MSNRRRGSILATSVSLVAVFLTLVVGGMAYVQSSQNRTLGDKFRIAAEQAARTGMDFVLGYGEANIDRETRLPRRWDSMSDGQVIDPIAEAVGAKSGDVLTDLRDADMPGEIVGANVHEYVLGRQGNYLTTFKARIEQFKVSDNMPRQYRIGVSGRVRKIRTASSTNIDTKERDSIIAERVILAHVGKQPVSRYAALIDIDVVRNWVPGEVIDGPVHINRGYVDDVPLIDDGRDLRTAVNVDADTDSTTTVPIAELRSRMDIQIDDTTFTTKLPGGEAFVTPPGSAPYPIFKDEVTVTEIGGDDSEIKNGTNTILGITNVDHNLAADAANVQNIASNAIRVNGKAWSKSASLGVAQYAAYHQDIFKNSANQNNSRYGSGFGDPRGPNPVPYPIQLPRSVRNRLAAAVGAPPGGIDMTEVLPSSSFPTGGTNTRWDKLPDGVYIPTTKFWAVDNTAGAPTLNDPPPTDSYNNFKTTGGIYIRGNVEIMRMAAGGTRSYYLFQLGPGAKATGGTQFRRCYVVTIDRATNQMCLQALNAAAVTADPNNEPDLLAKVLAAQLGTPPDLDSLPFSASGGNNPQSFRVSAAGNPRAMFVGEAAGTGDMTDPNDLNRPDKKPGVPPFNGVIYVDCAQFDHARPEAGLYSTTSTPVTGNILCLGDPGRPAAAVANHPVTGRTKQALKAGGVLNALENDAGDTVPYEGVATYVGSVPKGPATKLTIMTRGNIFIQNHILLTSLVAQNLTALKNEASKTYETLAITDSRDLCGLVSDKQVMIGLCAPSMTSAADRAKVGLIVEAAIAALGDPGLDFHRQRTPDAKKVVPGGYAGSFGVEGLLTVYGTDEDYTLTNKNLTAVGDIGGLTAYSKRFDNDPDPANLRGREVEIDPSNFTYFRQQKAKGDATGDVSWQKGYPGNPIYEALYGTTGAVTPYRDLTGNNPNKATRGKLRILGSLTEKKRGIKGQGNRSYDKDFKFDRRLLTIAPPIFPASLNVIVKTQSPFSPDQGDAIRAMPYAGTAAGNVRDLEFMGRALPALN